VHNVCPQRKVPSCPLHLRNCKGCFLSSPMPMSLGWKICKHVPMYTKFSLSIYLSYKGKQTPTSSTYKFELMYAKNSGDLMLFKTIFRTSELNHRVAYDYSELPWEKCFISVIPSHLAVYCCSMISLHN
jgi:hypothetical protein